jgi:hypothetical protein
MAPDAITLRASLDGFRGVERDVAVGSDQTLIDLHEVLQDAFDWDDDQGERLREWLSNQAEGLDRRQQNLFAFALDSGLAVSSSSATVS